jgi:hypothetical protein
MLLNDQWIMKRLKKLPESNEKKIQVTNTFGTQQTQFQKEF